MAHQRTFTLATPAPYLFLSVLDHGWPALAPWRWDSATQTLERTERLDNGSVALLRLQAAEAGPGIAIAMEGPVEIDDKIVVEVSRKMSRALRLDEDMSDFYARAAQHPAIYAQVGDGRGRLLRSPTLFEDVVKTICTTNITWSQTKAMVARLVDAFGAPWSADPTRRAFPTAEQLAAVEPDKFDAAARMGYRNAYVRELAVRVADGSLDLEGLAAADLPPAELRKAVKAIKGVGDYAANTIMMLLGRYEHLAIDSEFRAFVRPRYFDGAEVGDKELAAVYADWGDWQYLAYWFDNMDTPDEPAAE